MSALATARLLRLASPALPIGAYAWSGGLESAIDEGVVRDVASAHAWIADVLLAQSRWDAAIVWRLMTRSAERATWSARFVASRETRELRAETLQIGKSLVDLLVALDPALAVPSTPTPLPHAWALAALAWHISPEDALAAWLVTACDQQLAVLQKALPLGQVAAQRLLTALHPAIEQAAETAMTIDDLDLSSSTPGLAILSAHHEHQYSRLFRS